MSWPAVFERARDDVTIKQIQTALADHRAAKQPAEGTDDADDEPAVTDPPEPSPTRVVADADVLAADCCLDGPSRTVLDGLYEHSWMTLVASDQLLDDAAAVIERVADRSLADEWREAIDAWRQPVGQPAGDHPAVASAYRGGAMQLLSYDDQLTASAAGAALTDRFPVSVRQPDAFVLLFDPASLYANAHDDAYSGPDHEPRADQPA